MGNRAVGDAIRDHYKPQGADDDVPTAPVSVAVALADRIDTLTAFWAIGKKPTGSGDPFALRRAALAIIAVTEKKGVRLKSNLIVDRHFRRSWHLFWCANSQLISYSNRDGSNVSIAFPRSLLSGRGDGVIDEVVEALNGVVQSHDNADALIGVRQSDGRIEMTVHRQFLELDPLNDTEHPWVRYYRLRTDESVFGFRLPTDLLAFFHERLKVYLRDKGHRYDAIDAVLAKADGSLEDDLVLIVRKLEALEEFLKTDDGANLAAAYKRAGNILKAEGAGRMQSAGAGAVGEAADFIRPTVDEKLLRQAEEKALFAALKFAEEKASQAVAEERFADAMAALSTLRAPIDSFFDKVTVNADDGKLRANRLALLLRFIAATETVADLSMLEG